VQLPVYLMIRRGKTTIFFDAFENTKIVDLKKMLQGITKRPADDMRLFKENPVCLKSC
jgi:elongin-B